MPRVPTYDSAQVQANTVPNSQFTLQPAPDAGKALQDTGQAVLKGGAALADYATEQANIANTAIVTEQMNAAVRNATALQLEAMSLKGQNAMKPDPEQPDKALPDLYQEKLDKKLAELAPNLYNDAQRKEFANQTNQLKANLYGKLQGHMVQQQQQYLKDTHTDTIDTATQNATLLYGDKGARDQSFGAIAHSVDELAKLEGWSDKHRDLKLAELSAPLQLGIIKGLVKAGRADEADAFYNENSAAMTLQARTHAHDMIQPQLVYQAAEKGADDIWAQHGPQSANDAVNLFAMEKAVREKFAGDSDKAKAGVSALRERASAFNAQQAEQNANGINGVYKLIDSGVGMAKVRRSDEWLNLPDKQKHEIAKSLETESITSANREITSANRELTMMARNEKANLLLNGDQYLTASDPDVLAQMSRAQVEAKRTLFGMEATQTLLNKWDGLQKKGALAEARMDQDDFNQMADKLGLHPYATGNKEDDRRQLGVLKDRTEQLIYAAQVAKKASLTREEKNQLLQKEMAKTVSVNGWFSNTTTPVIQLTENQASRVNVPSGDKEQIISALLQKSKQHPGDASYAPTDANIRKYYLLNQSNAAKLITP